MSKAIPFIAGAAKNNAAVEALTKVLSSVGVSLNVVDASALGASKVALASGMSKDELAQVSKKLSAPVHSSVLSTGPSAALNTDKTYASAKFTVVSSFVGSDTPIPVTEKLDKFPRIGVSVASETFWVKASIKESAKVAVAKAAATDSKLTIFQKPQSAFKEHNALFVATVKEVADEAGVSVEVMNSQHVFNHAIMFSETLGVVITPCYSSSETFEDLATGIAGGAGMAAKAHKTANATIFAAANEKAGANPTGLLLAAVDALEAMGMSSEAKKIQAALSKVYTAAKTIPTGVKGGSADPAAFGAAVTAAMA
ncbi:hypothetical protein DIPPA_23529 [Diplonema papillatum]|nr:hypothetical protein DIPPA_23529 [Diplonema papillatum]